MKKLEPFRCKKHMRYKVMMPPRTGCEGCWKMWNEKHGVENAKSI